MVLKTFYWNPLDGQRARRTLWTFMRASREFRNGNAGDRFNVDLLQWAYPDQEIRNVEDSGRRLLLVGSIAHRVLDGDIVCGVGSKHAEVQRADKASIRILGVRGPLTLDAFCQAGHGVSQLRFIGDPGLLIAKLYPEVLSISEEPRRVIFIPHYRERFDFRSNKSYHVVSIDATPRDIAIAIRRAEFVYTSSLHGLIWAHALGRPVRLVAPRTSEPLHKYNDYFLSIAQPFQLASTIEEGLRQSKPTSPIDISSYVEKISLPTLAELEEAGIASDSLVQVMHS